ncbi:hypothetical protein VTI28DRAFT_913 [Corynascus sepedonium]
MSVLEIQLCAELQVQERAELQLITSMVLAEFPPPTPTWTDSRPHLPWQIFPANFPHNADSFSAQFTCSQLTSYLAGYLSCPHKQKVYSGDQEVKPVGSLAVCCLPTNHFGSRLFQIQRAETAKVTILRPLRKAVAGRPTTGSFLVPNLAEIPTMKYRSPCSGA